uniref:Uncharacterized protein LOC105137939 n=1 Tax=Rhizophora mucronata TaxID=61149 RepID=A0A2P2NYZ7_RHIMU
MEGYWRWRRRGYERINGSGRSRTNSVRLGSSSEKQKRRRFFWRIKNKPKLKFLKMASPKRFLVWLRDAYVNLMLGFAKSQVATTGGWGIGEGISSFGKRPLKEYDEKMIIDIYKSLVAAKGRLMSRLPPDAAAAKFGVPTIKLAAIME